jgi:hypothetical protein
VKLELAAQRCVQMAEVLGRYGQEHGVDVPTPRQPASDPIYLIYRAQVVHAGLDPSNCTAMRADFQVSQARFGARL